MIDYTPGLGTALQLRGSVFPSAAKIALPSALFTAALTFWLHSSAVPEVPYLAVALSVFSDSAAWTGFSSLVGFLVVFRTSQAYSRFWDGCTSAQLMRAEWFDACSSAVAFCKHSKVSSETILIFQHTLVRLYSMLHALALAEIRDRDCSPEDVLLFDYPLIDVEAIDPQSLLNIRASDCKVELVFQWIQQLMVEQINTGVLSIPAPLLSRAFQELATGMVHFHDALKISVIPFPFPYAQTCDCLLLLHSLGTPVVMCQWVASPWWAFILSFMQVFVLWCLNYISIELQNPFGSDANDLDSVFMQSEMNKQLVLLLSPGTKRTPMVCKSVLHRDLVLDVDRSSPMTAEPGRRSSFARAWSTISTSEAAGEPSEMPPPRPSQGFASTAASDGDASSVHNQWSSGDAPSAFENDKGRSSVASASNSVEGCCDPFDVGGVRLEMLSVERQALAQALRAGGGGLDLCGLSCIDADDRKVVENILDEDPPASTAPNIGSGGGSP